ncbi:MAG: hypothetical protein WBG70_23595 [Spirulinaceae cyanobacterium]
MKKTTNNLGKLLFSLSAAFILGAIAQQASFAQTTNPGEEDPFPSNEQDSIFGGENFNPFDLIHNSNLRSGTTGEEFRKNANEEIDDAAEEFRRLQKERLQQSLEQSSPAVSE